MRAITVIVAAPGQSSVVQEALLDWSQAGMLEPFVWVEAGADAQGGQLRGVDVTDGVQRLVDLERIAGGYERPNAVRVCGVSPLIEGWNHELHGVDQQIAQVLESNFGSTLVTRLRVTLGRADALTPTGQIAAEGWHNVLVSAEDSTGPAVGHTQLNASQGQHSIAIHSAAALAGLLGLWRGDNVCPFDGREPQPGRVVQLARSFFRQLDAGAVEEQLREQVLGIQGGLPLPLFQGVPSIGIEDVGLALGEMSQRFWQRHQDLVAPERFPYPETNVKPIGAWQALKMFFSFLGAALRRAPGEWASKLVARVSSAAAGIVANAVFGNAQSAYTVVVNGMLPDGTPAQWRDFGAAAAELSDALQRAGVTQEHYVRDPQGETWRDFTDASLTLADGEARSQTLPPVQIGANRGVLRNVDNIVPTTTFSDLPRHLAGFADQPPVAAYDVVGVNDLTAKLEALAVDPVNGSAASGSLHKLNSWKQQHGLSFATYLGAGLAQAITTTRAEITNTLQRILSAADPASAMEQAKQQQKRNARVLLIILGITLAVVALLVVLGTVGVLAGALLWVLLGVSVLGGIVTALMVFLRGQQKLFQLLNARRDLVDKLEVDQQNLRLALRDVRKQSDAYSQFLEWSRVLAVVLRQPHGRTRFNSNSVEAPLAGLPKSMGLGVAEVNMQALSQVGYDLRRSFFQCGWLDTPWQKALREAPNMLGPRGMDLGGDPRAMFSQPGGSPESLLTAWADQLEQHGVPETIGDQAWDRVLQTVSARAGLAEHLITEVRQNDMPVAAARFIADLVEQRSDTAQMMNGSLLSPRAQTTAGGQVTENLLRDHMLGLSRVICLTQLCDPLPEYELAAFSQPTRHIDWGVGQTVLDMPMGEVQSGQLPAFPQIDVQGTRESADSGTPAPPPAIGSPFGDQAF